MNLKEFPFRIVMVLDVGGFCYVHECELGVHLSPFTKRKRKKATLTYI